MKTSIGGEQQRSRLSEIKGSLGRVAAQIRRREGLATELASGNLLRIFVLAFGTQIPGHEVVDVLSIFDTRARSLKDPAQTGAQDGFERLCKVANQYDCLDWVKWARNFLDDKSAGILAEELSRDAKAAVELASLLPKSKLALLVKGWFAVPEAKQKAIELINRGKGRSSGFSLSRALTLKEIFALLENLNIKEDFVHFENHIFGGTPLCEALAAARNNFRHMRASLSADQCILFVLSDGEPTDGDPSSIVRELKSEGVSIVSCFVTDQDTVRPRTLCSSAQESWSKGALLMFDMASVVPEDSVFSHYLSSHGWEIGHEARMFVHVNNAAVLDEALCALLSLAEGSPV